MRVELIEAGELSPDHIARWRGWQAQHPSFHNPCLSPEFVQLVASVRSDVRVAILEQEGRVRGFFPFQVRRRVGRPVGGGLSDCHAVVAEPGFDWDPVELLRACGLNIFHFSSLRAGQPQFARFHRSVSPSPVVELGEAGFDGYVKERREAGSAIVAQTLSHARRVERRVGPLRFVFHDPDPQVLHRLIAWKREQYHLTGGLDVFSMPWTVGLLERVHAHQGAEFAGVLSTLSIGDTLVAAHIGMRSATVLHYWFPAYDRAHADHSPGRIMLLEMIRAAAANGLQAVELGAGGEGYKLRFANGAVPVAAGCVGAPSLELLSHWMRRKVEAAVHRLAVRGLSDWSARMFFRLDWERNHR